MSNELLRVSDLKISFMTPNGRQNAVDGVQFNLMPQKTLGIVGESGSGKSVTAMSLMRLIEHAGGVIESGRIQFQQQDLLKNSAEEMQRIRGRDMAMIFQEPMTSLNPLFTVGSQLGEVFRIHTKLSRKEIRRKSIELLEKVKIPAAEQRLNEYPHELSGGMRQRVMIAMALALNPKLLIADEPTTALDVTIQAQILRLLRELKESFDTAIILITHDLGVVGQICDEVIVMYAGRIVESGPVEVVLSSPSHPYTKGLLKARPKIGSKQERLPTIDGVVPSLGEFPVGCRFQNRCPNVQQRCLVEAPVLEARPQGSQSACFFVGGD